MIDAQAAISEKWERRLPGVPVGILWRAIDGYLCGNAMAPKERADGFNRLADSSGEALQFLENLDQRDLEALTLQWQLSPFSEGNELRLGELQWLMRQLNAAARASAHRVAADVKRGRGGQKSRRVELIRLLALDLQQSGIEVDARPNGQLAFAFECATDYLAAHATIRADDHGREIEISEPRPKDIAGTLRNALKGWKEN